MATISPLATKTVWQSDPVRHRTRSIVREFALNTSAHALPGIARSRSITNSLFWTLSFLLFTGTMSYFIVETIINYFSYPVQTNVNIAVDRSHPFPAVTFCNYGIARWDLIQADLANYLFLNNLTNSSASSAIDDNSTIYLLDFMIFTLNRNGSLAKYFFDIKDMMIGCTYNEQICTEKDFTPFMSTGHGYCYTFNAKSNNILTKPLRNINDGGNFGNLQIQLYAYSHLYIPYFTQDVSAGIVALIHDNAEFPQVEIAGLHLIPGKKHRLSYKKRATYFLPSPYTDCTEEIPPEMRAMFNDLESNEYDYSQTLCNILCIQTYTYQKCGCVHSKHWLARFVYKPGRDGFIRAPFCDYHNSCANTASTDLTNSESLWNEYCVQCKPACKAVDFSVTVSGAKSLFAKSFDFVKTFVENTTIPLPSNWSHNWRDEIQNNYLSLEVVCQTPMIENFTQDSMITSADIISNIGGQTGLWIGISLLSMMELVEMLFRVCRRKIYLLRHRIHSMS